MSKTIVLILLGFLVFIVIVYIDNRRMKNSLRKLDKDRPRLTKVDFITLLEAKGYNAKHAEVLHDQLMDFLPIERFSIYPEDDLHNDYKIDDSEVDDIIIKVCSVLNIREPNQDDCDYVFKSFDYTSVESILFLTRELSK